MASKLEQFKLVVLGPPGKNGFSGHTKISASVTAWVITKSTFPESYDPRIDDSYRKLLTIDGEHLTCMKPWTRRVKTNIPRSENSG